MDESKLDLDKLLSLRALAPTPDDISTLKARNHYLLCLRVLVVVLVFVCIARCLCMYCFVVVCFELCGFSCSMLM